MGKNPPSGYFSSVAELQEVIQQAAAYPEPTYRAALERLRWNTASEAIWLTYLDLFPQEAGSVVLNKVLPDAVLHKLAPHADSRIRSHIAGKRPLPPEILRD